MCLTETTENSPLPPETSTQLAELIVLTRALEICKEQRANIYTDSKYAFLVLHAHDTVCKEINYLTANGSPIKYHHNIDWLLCAIFLPKVVAIIHFQGHQKGVDEVSERNL